MFNLERGLGHMSISELTLKSKDEPVRRFEVFTGNGRRREWSDDQKARIIAESCEPGVTACSVARRHGLTPQQLFTWRRLARKPAAVLSVPGEDRMFAPAVVVSPGKPTSSEFACTEDAIKKYCRSFLKYRMKKSTADSSMPGLYRVAFSKKPSKRADAPYPARLTDCSSN
ncbi:IS66-like element accessory protein TnpA [Rhizobium laguerreae]|uniref:IS66-like element accessory protein TnpA n=2 Tax=Rhizobium laguerreae TaxID=1076926 RepID=UPI0028B04FDC|nr:transposase [Rhizobium laguerreae]